MALEYQNREAGEGPKATELAFDGCWVVGAVVGVGLKRIQPSLGFPTTFRPRPCIYQVFSPEKT